MTLQIKKKFINNDAIDGDKVKLLAGQALRVVSGLPGSAEKRLIELSNDGTKDIVLVNGKEVATKEYINDIIGIDAPVLTATLTALNAAMKDNDAATGVVNTLDNVRIAAGLTSSLSYTTPVGSRYLDSTTSLSNADAELDSAIGGIQDELDDTQTGAGLESDGSYLADNTTNYLTAATSLKDADKKLDAQIKTVSDTIGGIQDELDDTQTGAGLESDGSYLADNTTNYLTAATSLKDADKKLDAQIKTVQDELDDTQTGAGLESDGSYLADNTTNYLTAATSLKDADKKLDAELKLQDGRLDTLEARVHHKKRFVLSSTDISNGYVELNHEAMAKSVVASVGRLMIHETDKVVGQALSAYSDDFFVEVVSNKTRLVFVGNLVSPSEEQLEENDVIYVKYMNV